MFKKEAIFVIFRVWLYEKQFGSLQVACRVQIWRKTFCQNSDKFGYSFIKNDIMFIYIL